MKKSLALLMAVCLVASVLVVGAPAAFAADEPSEEEYIAWAEEHGYVVGEELPTSATVSGQGGINYGCIDWTEDLQVMAIKEFLKGGDTIADPASAQDDSGNNYRNMMQMATCYNNVPNCTNLELVLNPNTLCLCGVSEAGTSKTIEFTANPVVSVSWSKQLDREIEANGYNYYGSYGLTFYGDVRIFTPADLETEEGQDAAIELFDTYYNTDMSMWAGYAAGFKDAADDAAVREGKIAYISKTLASGAMVAYEVIPTRIVLTCPVFCHMNPQMNNAVKYTTAKDGKYPYELELSKEFFDAFIAYKTEFLKDEANVKAVEEYYAGPMFQMLDTMVGEGNPTNGEMALDLSSVAGIKTQTTYTPAAEE